VLISFQEDDSAVQETPTQRIKNHPDWIYLLREFYDLYRLLPAGGSLRIRAHQRRVRTLISKGLKANANLSFRDPTRLPVTAHLRRVLDQGRVERHGSTIRSIEAVMPELAWQFGYDKVPKGLEQRYAYAEIAGPNGPVVLDDLILGLVLFAPGCTYPAHAHDGISESYVCLSGAVSENDQGVYGPGSLIFNPPDHVHRITVSDVEPSLLAYAWEGPRDKLAAQKMRFTRVRGGTKA
jgi:dimethylpropiothetin dethiomethylase